MLMYPSLIALWLYRRSRQAYHAGRADKGPAGSRHRADHQQHRYLACGGGEGFSISHGQGVVIGDAVIGDDCRILQGVTIGRAGLEDHTDAPAAYPGSVIG